MNLLTGPSLLRGFRCSFRKLVACVISCRTTVLLLGAYSFGVDVLAESSFALLLKLLDVTDQSCIAVDLEFFVLLYFFLSLLLLVVVLVYQLVYLCYVCWCLFS